MHRALTRPLTRQLARRRSRERDERGAVAIMVAVLMTGMLVIVALVLDFGLVRIDRQIDRNAADSATLAGLHALNTGDGTPHPYVGVCTAIRYLEASGGRFEGVDETAGTWTNGNGGAIATSGCTDVALRAKVCKKDDKASWARWELNDVTSRGVTLDILIESGYDRLAVADDFLEDTYTDAADNDDGDTAYAGCDQLAVTIRQEREPTGFGGLATSSDLRTSIRSVGRIKAAPGNSAPAMLLLKQTGCPVLKTGAAGGTSFIHVLGAVSSDGRSQPGTIHSDSDGVGCNGSNNSWVFGGLGGNGIVAYAAPTVANPSLADASKPGSITSVASANGLTGLIIRDALANVYSSTALDGTGGTKVEPSGRSLVTRRLVDERYFTGVKGAISGANSVFQLGSSSAPAGWTSLSAANLCKPTQAEVNASVTTANTNSSGRLYIGCTGPNGFEGSGSSLTVGASQVYFKGKVGPASGSVLSLPNATKVYVGNHMDKPDAISISNGTSLRLNDASTNLDASGYCATGQSASKTALFVRSGQFKQTGGLLRMCRTTAFMMGGQTDGCVPATTGTAPNKSTPCGGGLGTGQFTQNGGDIDWSAPDTLDATSDPVTGVSTPAAIAAWENSSGPEDLALWSESGSNSSTNYSMAGGGLFRVRGVYMAPNADPFIISGGSSLNLTNAQYVASAIELNGNTTNIKMSVDPNSAVTLPDQELVGLVR